MRANELRHSISIQARSAVLDALGQPSTDSTAWSTIATVRAKITPTSGRERMASDAGRSEISHIVAIRYQSQFSDPVAMAANRILYGSRYGSRILNITSCRDVDECHFELELTCSEGVNNG